MPITPAHLDHIAAGLLPTLPKVLPDDAPPPPCAALPELWFPTKTSDDAESRAYVARTCARCEHRDPCKQAGRDNDEHGIWGGETPRQRYEERRKKLKRDRYQNAKTGDSAD